MTEKKHKILIEGLRKTGLSYEEALIYFTLIQHGKNGTYVKDLTNHLSIARTSIYSILNRLIEKQCVIEGERPDAPKNVKVFIAVKPTTYINKILLEKKRELEELEELKLMIGDHLEVIYQKGIEYQYEDLDPFLQPYFKPLLDKKWKVVSQVVEKGVKTFGYDVYDCELKPQKTKFIDKCGFLVSVFSYNIEEEENALSFYKNQLKRKLDSEIRYQTEFKAFEITDGEIELFGRNYPSFILKIQFTASQPPQEFIKTAFIPIKNKVFTLWAESYRIVQEMAEVIFKVEKIKIS